MSILDNLYPGSFRGVPFLIEDSSVSGGRKQVVHEFPNSDKRYVEDLGLMNESISIQACIPTASYFIARDSLKAAMERKGYGILIHPFYGTRQVAASSYTIDESTASLGYIKLRLEFKQAQDLDSLGTFSNENLSILAARALTNEKESFYATYTPDSNYRIVKESVVEVGSDINNIIEISASEFIRKSTVDNEALAIYEKRLSDMKVNYASYLQLQKPSINNYYDKIKLLLVALDTLAASGSEGIEISKRLSLFQLSTPVSTAVTAAQKQRALNKNTLREMVLLFAFTLMCRNISYLQADSVDDVLRAKVELDRQYQVLFSAVTLSSQVLNDIQTMRSAANAYLETSLLTTPQIQEIRIYGEPLSIVEYSLYGTLEDESTLPSGQDRTSKLRLLNRVSQPDSSYIEGNLKTFVFTDE